MLDTTSKDPITDLTRPAEPTAVPGAEALATAVAALQKAVDIEEQRFNNLNTRAITLLSASSLITALAGLFAKNIQDHSLGSMRYVAAGLLLIALGLLLAVALVIILMVLKLSGRSVFGNNALTNEPASMKTAVAVQEVMFREYLAIHKRLAERNRTKARGLVWAYRLFATAVCTVAIGSGSIVLPLFG